MANRLARLDFKPDPLKVRYIVETKEGKESFPARATTEQPKLVWAKLVQELVALIGELDLAHRVKVPLTKVNRWKNGYQEPADAHKATLRRLHQLLSRGESNGGNT